MACHPLDTVKTRLQVSGGNEGMLSVLRTLAARDGVLSLWRGAAAPTLTVASSTSLVFTINSMIRQALLANFPALARPNPHVARDASQPPTVLAHSGFFVAGFIGGAISSFITGPAELAKTKVQAQGMAVKGQHAEAAAVRYRGSLHCMYEVGKRYGLAGLFQGQLSCTARNALGQCAYFGMYAKVSDALKPADSISVPLHIAFASGGIAGLSYWTACYPVDVIKSRLTAEPSNPAHRRFSTMREAYRYILANEGLGGFYRGFGPCLARGLVCNSVVFPVYELVKQYGFGIAK